MVIVTARDDRILMAIYEIGDGVLARRHIKRLFWPDKTKRAMQKVMSRLYHRGYIERETVYYPRMKRPRSEPVYRLRSKGIFRVTEQLGVEVPYQPKNEGENQMRILERRLREEEIRWVRILPSTAKLEHDFFVVDFRLMVEEAAGELPAVTVEWTNESAFRTPRMDKVKFTVKDRDGRTVEQERGVCPDGLLLIEDMERKRGGLPHKLHLPVEVDMGTHPVSSRYRTHKAAPYAAYIGSPAFKARFGTDAGNWLVVTTGKRRMENLMHQTHQTVGDRAGLFFFTYWSRLGRGNVLTTPIWHKVGKEAPVAILT